MKRRPFLLLFFILFLFSSCKATSLKSYSKIIKVIDGDTLVLEGGVHLRLIGLDTPELRIKIPGGFKYQPQPFAEEAKRFTRKLAEGKEVRIEFDVEKKDKYGRLLGYCFIREPRGELFLNEVLLREGFAVLYTFPPNVKYIERFVKAQRYARQNKKGLWGVYKVISSQEAHKFIGQIRTVRGKVLSTYSSDRAIFLNFGQDYKSDFTVVIFKDALKYFKEKGIDVLNFYRGKTVEVSGRIREYQGPEIIAGSPYQIEVLE